MLPAAVTGDWTRSRRARQVRLLVVDDDEAVRALYATLLKQLDGVGSIAAAADGVEAVQLAKAAELDVAILDLNMPRLDGVDAALAMAALQPALAIALQSSDPQALWRRADGLGLAVFDKLRFDQLVAWIEEEVACRLARPLAPPQRLERDFSCARCGYGVAINPPPARCPMCNSTTEWIGAATGRAL